MKIILANNMGIGFWSPDELICENINVYFGDKIVNLLNENLDNEEYLYKLVDDNYKLYEGSY